MTAPLTVFSGLNRVSEYLMTAALTVFSRNEQSIRVSMTAVITKLHFEPKMNRVSEYQPDEQSIRVLNRVSVRWTECQGVEQSISEVNRVSEAHVTCQKSHLPRPALYFFPVEFTICFWVSNNEVLANLIDLSFPLLQSTFRIENQPFLFREI